jgi:hypothetical protein
MPRLKRGMTTSDSLVCRYLPRENGCSIDLIRPVVMCGLALASIIVAQIHTEWMNPRVGELES